MSNNNKDQYLNRDLSWLEFNSRVLDEAADRGNPLIERLKFIAIFSSNLDEFYMVRMAGVYQQIGQKYVHLYGDCGYVPENLIAELDTKIRDLTLRQHRLLYENVLPALEKEGVRILNWSGLTPTLQKNLREKFISRIMPVLTPIGIDQSHPFPLIPNLGLELLIRLTKAGETQERFAVMQVPPVLPRFIEVEKSEHTAIFLPIEELIANNLDLLFNRCNILECSAFRITRDMDFFIDEDSIDNLLTEMQTALQKNAQRKIIRLEHSTAMTKKSRTWLCSRLDIAPERTFSLSGMLNLKSLFELSGIENPKLHDIPLPPLPSIHFSSHKSICDTIRDTGPFLVHHPYESFDPVIRFLEEAAVDPDVLAIKQTLYRVSGNSPIVAALMRAARNGKQVSVLVELKARFDEENNINWARELDHAGAHVVYGIAGLKVHCKTLLVVRRENDGIHRYMHIGTGNYNDKTAKLYTDLGFFTDDRSIGADVSSLFNVITGFSSPPQWEKLLVSPFNTLDRLLYMIDRESKLSTEQNPGSITIKANSLIDYEVIEHLYAAARRNVKITMQIRGICGINPYSLPKKFEKNITVVSVVDRFLEHARIYRFGNNGHPEYYLGSADMMQRNLRHRIEVLFPVEKEDLRRELDFILECGLSDRRKGRRLQGPNQYGATSKAVKDLNSRSQIRLYDFYSERFRRKRSSESKNKQLTVFNSPDSGKK